MDDLINRQVIMDAFCDMRCDGWDCCQEKCFRLRWIKELPPNQKKYKEGEWIDNTYCSECGWANQVEPGFIGPVKGFNFCPNCGIKMKENNN